MWAEITAYFSKNLNCQTLVGRLPPSSDLNVALSRTVFKNSPDATAFAIYAQSRAASVFIVFSHGDQSLKVHVENTIDGGSLIRLKESIEEDIRLLRSATKKLGTKINRVTVQIHSEGNLILIGHEESFWHQLWGKLKTSILGDLLVLVGTFGGAIFLGVGEKQSLMAAVSAVFAFIIWLIIELIFERRSLEYVET